MAVALPLNTVRQFKVNGQRVLFVKVSHHGSWRQRWRTVAQVTRGQPYDRSKHWELVLRDNPVVQKRQRKNRARAVRISNRERSRISRSRTIRHWCFYCVVHFSETELLARTKKSDPAGWIVMVPCRTKRQALSWGQREEFGGRRYEAVRGLRLETDEPTIQRLAGYERYVPNEGQAWIQKRTLERLMMENGSDGRSHEMAGQANVPSGSTAPSSSGEGLLECSRSGELCSVCDE